MECQGDGSSHDTFIYIYIKKTFILWHYLLSQKVRIRLVIKPKYVKVNLYIFFVYENLQQKIKTVYSLDSLFTLFIILFIGMVGKALANCQLIQTL